MNKYFPPKPLAKDLSVVMKTVRKGTVWSQEKSAVKCRSPPRIEEHLALDVFGRMSLAPGLPQL